MRLISCYIANFGLHHDKKIDFTPGMNSFAWNNGAGKTTLSVFLKAMLYGFGDNRTKKDDNERKKYMPWQGGRYGGSITFEADGKTFIAERSFGARVSDDTFTLYDERTGGVSNFYTENLGKELFGIDCDGFIRTVFWSEKSIPKDERVSPSVASRLSDIMGADGDVGSYDTAIKALEERRKAYQKRGGGEIAELTARISELKRMIDELELLARDGERLKGELDSTRERIKELSSEKEKLSERLLEIERIKTRRKYRATYFGYVQDMNEEAARVKALDDFFGGNIPTSDKIKEIQLAKAEADAIRSDLSTSTDANDELDRLSRIYSGIGQVDIDEAEATLREIGTNSARLQELRSGADEYSREMRRLFPAKVPTASEIEENIQKAAQKNKSKISPIAILGIILFIGGLGAGFVFPAIFGLCVLGAILFIIGFLRDRGNGTNLNDVHDFVCSIVPGFDGDVLGCLYEKKNDLERYDSLAKIREDRLSELTEKVDKDSAFIRNFFTRVGVDSTYPEYAMREIKQNYLRYSALLLSEEREAGDRFRKRTRENELRILVSSFCSGYPTVTQDPLSEIEGKARERAYRIGLLADKTAACEKFKIEYGIVDEEESFDESEEFRIREKIREIDESIVEQRRSESTLAARYSNIVARLDTEEDIRTEIAMREERLSTCKRSLYIIEKTKAILEIAHENMTLRYTGKTQERFSHYMSVISGEVGEYKLDTDFGITRSDSGAIRSEDQYSRGTKELYSLAIRLALTDSLYDGELPFLVLDDPFIAYDDGRGKRARALLSAIAKERQILYFTCSEARNI